MATSAKIDVIRNISASEHLGVVIALTRQILVLGLADKDIGALDTAVTYLNGEGYTVGSTPPDYPNLKLTDRNPAVEPRDNTKVWVTL
ncbi:unnamed protein product, partial [marine sediment metagenome]